MAKIYEATMRNRGLFKRLWLEHLKTENGRGNHLLPTETNVGIYTNVFDNIVSGRMAGVVLLMGEEGVLMAGEVGTNPFESTKGKVATIFGLYGKNDEVAKRLWDKAAELLSEQGFKAAIHMAQIGPKEKILGAAPPGFKPQGFFGFIDLPEHERPIS